MCGWAALTWTRLEGLGAGCQGKLVPWCPLQSTFAPASRMYRVYGKKNIKLEPVPLKGASLDPR